VISNLLPLQLKVGLFDYNLDSIVNVDAGLCGLALQNGAIKGVPSSLSLGEGWGVGNSSGISHDGIDGELAAGRHLKGVF
jgi:hypothetical protein